MRKDIVTLAVLMPYWRVELSRTVAKRYLKESEASG